MLSQLPLDGCMPPKLLESSTYKACIDGFTVALTVEDSRVTCVVTRHGYSAPLDKLLRHKTLRCRNEVLDVEVGTVRAIREWVQSKTPHKVSAAPKKTEPPKKRGQKLRARWRMKLQADAAAAAKAAVAAAKSAAAAQPPA